jgi:hypothetical protein
MVLLGLVSQEATRRAISKFSQLLVPRLEANAAILHFEALHQLEILVLKT